MHTLNMSFQGWLIEDFKLIEPSCIVCQEKIAVNCKEKFRKPNFKTLE